MYPMKKVEQYRLKKGKRKKARKEEGLIILILVTDHVLIILQKKKSKTIEIKSSFGFPSVRVISWNV